jgi:anti-sigma regulatory factor (Ser/Thr protein kinase)
MLASAQLSYSIPGGRAAAARARAVVTEALAPRLDDRRLADVRLLVSELVTNGVLHGDATDAEDSLTLSIASNAVVRVDVIDHGGGFVPGTSEPDPVGGWGLMLVEELADRWGVTRDGETRVWFEMAA